MALLAFREFQSPKLIMKPLSPTSSTAYRFTFEIPNLYLNGTRGRILPLVRCVEVQDDYSYVFRNGTVRTPQNDEAYCDSTTNVMKQLHVLKPLSGTWSFQVKRKIKRSLFLPTGPVSLKETEELWISKVFTNQIRPPDVNSLTVNSPFE